MKTLALADGDLVVTPFGHETVEGSAKVKQELICAFLEPYGFDRFHPEYGSTISNLVGQALDPETEMLVLAEANRVIQSYVQVQAREVLTDVLGQTKSRYTTADVVRSVDDISAQVGDSTITVTAVLTTQSGQTVTLSTTTGL